MSKALTLSGLMALLLPKERLFVIHHLGADISEAVAGGTVEELERTRCVEVCGNNIVELAGHSGTDPPRHHRRKGKNA